MKYRVEELLELVSMLSDRFTGKESTSVSYETARQLMGAVLYCLKEADSERGRSLGKDGEVLGQNNSRTAKEAYEIGYLIAEEKTRSARERYNQMTPKFNSYGNMACEDTVTKGLPEFFRRYDLRFHPQDHLVTLDYPILTDLNKLKGIDAISIYLDGLIHEQRLLEYFPEQYVRKVLSSCRPGYETLFINLSNLFIKKLICRFLIRSPLKKIDFCGQEYAQLEMTLKALRGEKLEKQMEENLKLFTERIFPGDHSLYSYLRQTLPDLGAELTNAADNGSLQSIV